MTSSLSAGTWLKPDRRSHPLSLTAWWILFWAFCNCLGWGLSAIGQLNAVGYGVAFGAALVTILFFRWPAPFRPRLNLQKLRRRFRRLFPLSFAVIAAMAILGGLIHPPGNPDGLTQRIPRVLHWLSQDRWHWIDNSAASFNTRACGFEWLMAPMLALVKTDRWVFLYNSISFLLLPGLFFSVFRRLGVRPRAAWYWMWVAPTGLCYAMQAGSIGNDAAGAFCALAALHFALRAKNGGEGSVVGTPRPTGISDVWLSLIAAGLLSGMKTSNLPLGLPWLVAIWPSFKLLWQRPLASFGVGLFAAASSLLPLMFLLHQHDAGWLGMKLDTGGGPNPNPLVALFGNLLNLAVENFLPPLFPIAGWWNSHFYKLVPEGLQSRIERTFEPGAARFSTMEIQFEVWAGIGLGVSLLLIVSWLWLSWWRFRTPDIVSRSARDRHEALVRWSVLVSWLAFLLKLNVSGPARLVAPYYAPLMPLLLASAGHDLLVRRRWWQALGVASFALGAVMLIVNPPRALFPAARILSSLASKHPQSQALARGAMLYEAYPNRWDALAPVRDRLPPDARDVGFVTAFMSGSTMEASLWRPYGSRRIWPLRPEANRAELQTKNVHYIVVGTDSATWTAEASSRFNRWLEDWTGTNGGKIIAQPKIVTLATAPRTPWYLIEISPAQAVVVKPGPSSEKHQFAR